MAHNSIGVHNGIEKLADLILESAMILVNGELENGYPRTQRNQIERTSVKYGLWYPSANHVGSAYGTLLNAPGTLHWIMLFSPMMVPIFSL